MAKLLFTMVPANDLGLPTRLVPIPRALADRSHEVALFNPPPAPAKLIREAGLTNLAMPSPAMPVPGFDPSPLSSAWDLGPLLFGRKHTCITRQTNDHARRQQCRRQRKWLHRYKRPDALQSWRPQ
jgi:hypothetical protein